jgi:selenocysteine lyase/cysteine desulfurase
VPHPADDAVVDLFRRALTARTRVISVSHVLFTTGYIMPVAALARLCRERNVILVVDGAHPPGLMPVDLRALDADFYASSPHKWLLAPQGTGLLWMRDEWRTKLWPTLASGGWDDMTLGAHRFNHLGTLDESRLAGLDAALRFHIALGPERVVARVRALRDRLLEALRAHPAVHIVSPADARAAGMVSFRVDGIEALELQRRLSDIDAGGGRRISVRTRVIGEYNYNWMRLSPHVYNSPADLDEAVRLIDAARRA